MARIAEALDTNVSSIMEQPGHDHRPDDTLFFSALDPHGVIAMTEAAKYIDVFV